MASHIDPLSICIRFLKFSYLRYWVWWTWTLVDLKLEFYELHQAEKSIPPKFEISNWRIAKVKYRAWVRNLKLKVPLITYIDLCGCQLVLRTSKSAGAGADVQNFGGCQAPVAPVLTQALDMHYILKEENYKTCIVKQKIYISLFRFGLMSNKSYLK